MVLSNRPVEEAITPLPIPLITPAKKRKFNINCFWNYAFL